LYGGIPCVNPPLPPEYWWGARALSVIFAIHNLPEKRKNRLKISVKSTDPIVYTVVDRHRLETADHHFETQYVSLLLLRDLLL